MNADMNLARESASSMTSSLLLILFAVVCGISGQLTMKLGMDRAGRIGATALSQPLETLVTTAANPLVLTGLGFYAMGTIAWLTVLSRVPLSYAYPLLALSYAITPILAWLVLNESMPTFRLLGILTICLGVLLVSRT
jgi:drug/metabolite transporter (DMT)-like permease